MARTIEKTIYKYDELNDAAKEKARDWYSSDLDYDWHDCVYEDFERICDILGIELGKERVQLMNGEYRLESKIYFRGFYHQGSGSVFEGDYLYKKGAHKAIREYAPIDETLHDVADSLLALQKANMYRVTGVIGQMGRYYSLSVDAYVTNFINGGSDCANAEIDDTLRDIMSDLNDWLYSKLESEYEYLISDEQVSESIIANEYEFNEDGSFYG